ncbi:MAG: AbrB/MazE/SpoVT family DNA-binding domain-containing protein [Gammaproteobacteria bacterium HGW-Gammaproteobacteria-1]|jgi:putative addiction module antidote|nr:MAG: AbrB/MazE/SpoVT family DNA-binding domain-containing protein [Gammaproteobacteria bacterium HGW-Gammaproteobacteria-1]
MHTLKLRKVGSSIGVILPKELLERLHLQEGDQLFAEENSTGLHLTPLDPDFEATMAAFERTRRKYRNALHQLAK